MLFRGAFLAFFLSLTAGASDHIDGPVTTKHAISDLTDLYAFQSFPSHLNLVLNVRPLARKKHHFSEKVNYTFFIRKAQRDLANKRFVTDAKSEIQIVCSFTTPKEHDRMTATCRGPNGLSRTVGFNEIDFGNQDMRLFAGLRADPFFFNLGWSNSASNKGKIDKPKNANIMDRTNVLSIVIQLDWTKLFNNPTLVAIVATSSTLDKGATRRRQLDRIGRPEVTNVTMVPHAETDDFRDLFNQEKPFQISAKNLGKYRKKLKANIKFYDAIDKETDWTQDQINEYVDLILDDFLVVDLSRGSSEEGYFGIERNLLRSKGEGAVGGRKLTDDIMDTLFTYLVNRDQGEVLRDGVNEPWKRVSRRFPFLASPDDSAIGWKKAAAVGKLLGQE